MKKTALFLALILILSVPTTAYAAVPDEISPFVLRIYPQISFDGGTATCNIVLDSVKPLKLPGNIHFCGFDIYGMIQIRVNILPQFTQQICQRNRGKIENTHSITNFSKLISKVCINYGGTGQI